MKRRKLLSLLATTPFYHGCRKGVPETLWQGILFHNPVSIRYRSERNLDRAITTRVQELEQIFSLYESSSELALLNSQGSLSAPSRELRQLLEQCRTLHQQTEGLFDPSIQSYWSWLQEQHQVGKDPTAEQRDRARATVDFSKVQISSSKIELNGTQLTLNSVAQGFASDQLVAFLQQQGVDSALVNLGEYRALGGPFEIAVRHPSAANRILKTVTLEDRSLAVSSGSGHRLSATGKDNHLLSPHSGESPPALRTVLVFAPDATTADAWATILSLQPGLASSLPEGVEVETF